MAISDNIHSGRHERISSSGAVFSAKSSITLSTDKTDKGTGFLLCLIEEELELPFRSQNCLNNTGIKLIGQLVQKTGEELLALKNFGRRSLGEIEEALSDVGLMLEMNLDFPPWRGDDNDAELIRILTQQRVNGGFQGDQKRAPVPGMDDAAQGEEGGRRGANGAKQNKPSLRHTERLRQRLETEFKEGRPYLTNVIRHHRKWLQEEMRKESAK